MYNNQSRKYFEIFLTEYTQERYKEKSGFSLNDKDCIALQKSIQNQSNLLSHINVKATKANSGAAEFFDLSYPIAGKIDTRYHSRVPQSGFNPSHYVCQYTNYDVALKYSVIDAWTDASKDQNDFILQAKTCIERRIALDRIMVGFNGISSAMHSNSTTNRRLQDVNKGWLQVIREQAPERVVAGLQYGTGQTQRSLSALLRNAVNSHLSDALRDDPLLVAIVGADLLPDPQIQANMDEKGLPDLAFHQQRQGGMRAASAAFFPGNSVLITRLDNLSLYFNANSHRLHYENESNVDQIALYQQTAEAFAVENLDACLLLDDVTEVF